MKRLVWVGLVFGLLNGVAAAAALAGMYLYGVHSAEPTDFGWFVYAPLNESISYGYNFPWECVVVPVVLLALNALLLPLAVRRGWLNR